MSDNRFALGATALLIVAVIVTLGLLIIAYVQLDNVNRELTSQAATRAKHSALICPAINRLNRDAGYPLLPCTQITKEDRP